MLADCTSNKNWVSLFTPDAAPALLFRPESGAAWLAWAGAVLLGCGLLFFSGSMRGAAVGQGGARNAQAWRGRKQMTDGVYAWLCVGVCLSAAHRALDIPQDALALGVIPTMVVTSSRVGGGDDGGARLVMNVLGLAELVAGFGLRDGVPVAALWSAVLGARYLASAPSIPSLALRALLLGWQCVDAVGVGMLGIAELFASVGVGGGWKDGWGVPERAMLCLGSWILAQLLADWLPLVLVVVAALEWIEWPRGVFF